MVVAVEVTYRTYVILAAVRRTGGFRDHVALVPDVDRFFHGFALRALPFVLHVGPEILPRAPDGHAVFIHVVVGIQGTLHLFFGCDLCVTDVILKELAAIPAGVIRVVTVDVTGGGHRFGLRQAVARRRDRRFGDLCRARRVAEELAAARAGPIFDIAVFCAGRFRARRSYGVMAERFDRLGVGMAFVVRADVGRYARRGAGGFSRHRTHVIMAERGDHAPARERFDRVRGVRVLKVPAADRTVIILFLTGVGTGGLDLCDLAQIVAARGRDLFFIGVAAGALSALHLIGDAVARRYNRPIAEVVAERRDHDIGRFRRAGIIRKVLAAAAAMPVRVVARFGAGRGVRRHRRQIVAQRVHGTGLLVV